MSSDQVDISTYMDNVVNAIQAASSDTATETDGVKENDPGLHSTQTYSNSAHSEEIHEICESPEINEFHEDITTEDIDENVIYEGVFKDFKTEDVKVKMVHEDHQMCSSLDSKFTNEQDLREPCSNAVGKHDKLDKQSLCTNTHSPKSAYSLPDFDQLCDANCSEEETVLDDEPLSCEACSHSVTSQIPYFEKCYTHDYISITQTESNISETVTPSVLEDKSLLELMQEIRDDLSMVGDMTNPETDLGLGTLFENQHVTDEPHSEY